MALQVKETKAQRLEREARLKTAAANFHYSSAVTEGRLEAHEVFWRENYSWLKDCGYLLRPRYAPGWTAPWLTDKSKHMLDFEESARPTAADVMDATRVADGSYVALKRCNLAEPSSFVGVLPESQIYQKFSSEPLASDPKNHCVRHIEILRVPEENSEELLIVMPFLYVWDDFSFATIGEAVDFFSQVFEGLQFMHNNHVWHGDCKYDSIMMDAAPILTGIPIPHPWNPSRTRDYSRRLQREARSRTQHPVKYYWADFDLSGVHDPSTGPPLVFPGYGGTREVPEWAFPDQRCDPFAVDVWCLGFMIREHFTEGFGLLDEKKMEGFEFIHELVADMCQDDPAKRPTMDVVVERFSRIRAGLSLWKLRSRFVQSYKRPVAMQIIRSAMHWAQQLYYIARHLPAIPTPKD
ncbi:kinase-like domain-containing protein [Mycena belliarum]|uniref:Kinase-like domain-containing protein n=1 Tax=Mycena belliarum TaxID=1033014 RepID=A0AAD6XQI7_9AGAR|nr:kinase-like domain-containing protein [Mycena belliae]